MWRSKRTVANLTSGDPDINGNENQYASCLPRDPLREPMTQSSQHASHTILEENEDSPQVVTQSNDVAWNENITFDEDDLIETIVVVDSEGKIMRKKGNIPVSQVWVLDSGLKIIVKFNKFKQPIGKGGHLLVKFLGEVAKQGGLCPLGETSWIHMHDCYKVDMVKLTRGKFHIPIDLDIDEMILSHVNGKWRTLRHKLKKLYFDPNKTEKQIAIQVPNNVIKEQWVRLVSYWFSPTGKKLSSIGKRSRSQKVHHHTTGSKSFAQKKHEFAKKEKREPSTLEAWRLTHVRKDGSYVDNTTTKEFVETAEKLVDERLVEQPGISKTIIEDDVFNEMMYDDENPNQRVVGYGHGVSQSQVFGLKANLRNCVSIEDSFDVKEQVVSVVKENAQLRNAHAALQSQFNEMKSALARSGIVFNISTGRNDSGRNTQHEDSTDDALNRQDDQNRTSMN